jgi:aryl-alcohol dehydrogenase-like predicted oxidoreductase
MLRREIEGEILPYCARNNIGVIVYSPLQKGLLTGAISRERIAALPPDDHRHRDPEFQEPRLSINLAVTEKLKEIGEKYDATPAQVAIAWILRRPEITAAIVGLRRPSQVEDIVPAADIVLCEEDIATIEKILQERESRLLALQGEA